MENVQNLVFFGIALLFFTVGIIDIVGGWFRERM